MQPSGMPPFRAGTPHMFPGYSHSSPARKCSQADFLRASEERGKKALPLGFWELGGWVRQSYHLTTGSLHFPEPPAHYRGGHTQQKTPRFLREESGGAGDNQWALCSQSHCVPPLRRGVRQGLWPLPAWQRPSLYKAGPGRSLLGSASTLMFRFQQIL